MVSAMPFLSQKEVQHLQEYLKAQNKTNETVLRNTYSSDELGRFSKSDYRLAPLTILIPKVICFY